MSKRVNAIQEVKESVALLTQLLQDYDSAASNQSNAELLQVKKNAFNQREIQRVFNYNVDET